jgi:hypothetical protein
MVSTFHNTPAGESSTGAEQAANHAHMIAL